MLSGVENTWSEESKSQRMAVIQGSSQPLTTPRAEMIPTLEVSCFLSGCHVSCMHKQGAMKNPFPSSPIWIGFGSQAAVVVLGLRARYQGWPPWRLDTMGLEPEEEYVKSWDPNGITKEVI